MERLPELVQQTIAEYVTPKNLRKAWVQLCIDPTYTNNDLKGYYSPGRNSDPKDKRWLTCECGRVHSVYAVEMWVATSAGNLVLAKSLFASGEPVDERALIWAAHGGHIPVVRWLRALGVKVTQPVVQGAIGSGSIALLEELKDAFPYTYPLYAAACFAMRYGTRRVVQWFLASARYPPTPYFYGAARRPNAFVLDMLVEVYGPPDAPTAAHMVRDCLLNGNVVTMTWVLQYAPFHLSDAHLAERNPEMLRWAVGRGAVVTEGMLVSAAMQPLEQLQWVAGRLDQVSARAVANAVRAQRLENVQWLLAQGHPWSTFAANAGIYAGNIALLDWMRANGCPFDGACFTAAVVTNNRATLQWVKCNGVPAEARTREFASPKLRRWLREHRPLV